MTYTPSDIRNIEAAALELFEALHTLVTSLALNDEDGLTEFAEPMCMARAALAKATQPPASGG